MCVIWIIFLSFVSNETAAELVLATHACLSSEFERFKLLKININNKWLDLNVDLQLNFT